jgi:hypothetical protein
VPLYLFLGGAAGASSVLAAFADVSGRPTLTKVGRLVAGGGSIASVGFLIHDLGRPERFLHMLRVFKPTSPLSVGTYSLSPFSAAALWDGGRGAAGLVAPAEALRRSCCGPVRWAHEHLHRSPPPVLRVRTAVS